MASKFLDTAFGVSNGGLAAWAVAGGGAYYFIYRPDQQEQADEVARWGCTSPMQLTQQWLESAGFILKCTACSQGAVHVAFRL
jgi:hypothetical protein